MLQPEHAESYAREHVAYEVSMLVATARKLRTTGPGPERNAFLESFVIHARVLDDFLCGDRERPSAREFPRVRNDDVVARDYATAWPRVERHFMPTKERKVANKLVAHLTDFRIDGEAVDVHRTALAVLNGFREFLAKLSADRLEWFAVAGRTAGIYLDLPTPSAATDGLTTTNFTTGSINAVLPALRVEITRPKGR